MAFAVTTTITRPRARSVNTYAALRQTHGAVGDVAVLHGFGTASDGGAGTFWWEDGVTTGHNIGTIVVPASGARGRWVRQFEGPLLAAWFGAVADNSTDNSDAIEAARAVAIASNKELRFARAGTGVYRFSRTIQHPGSFLELSAEPGVELRFTGTGKILTADAGAVTGTMYGIAIRNLILVGSTTATVGLYLRGVLNSVIDNVRVEDVEDDGLRQEFGSLNVISNFVCSRNVRNFTSLPERGIYIGRRGVTNSTSTRIVNPTIEGLYASGQIGIVIDYADKCSVIGGTSEGNSIGIEITANGGQHRIESLWMEDNTTADIICAGWWCTFDGCLSTSLARLSAGSYGNVLRDGSYQAVTNLSVHAQRYDGCAISGTLTDAVTSGAERRYWNTPLAGWSGA